MMRAADGKYYGYSEGKHDIPYSQSNGKYLIEGAGFPDAWGAGAYELSEIASYLDEEYRQKFITILETMADFWNRDYMVCWKGGRFYYRTEDVEPANPKPQKRALRLSALGSDLIYSIVSLNEMKQNTDKYDANLAKFFKSYCEERANHSGDSRINYLDSRMVELAKYFKSKNMCAEQVSFVFEKLPNFYKKRRGNAVFMTGGATTVPSTIPLLDLYAQLGKKDKFMELWGNIWTESFGEKGIKIADGYNFTINNSAYPVLLDAGYTGWTNNILTDIEFVEAVKKYYTFKGDKRNYRDLDDWVTEVDDWDRENKGWKAMPFEHFGEKIEPEAYYYGLPQAYTLHRSFLMADQAEALKKENQARNCYLQFVMPLGTHGERMRYALATTFNMLDTSKSMESKFEKAVKEDKMEMKVVYKEPKVPKGMPCLGIKDVTEIYYMDRRTPMKDGYEITGVTFKGKDIAWQVSHILNYKQPFGDENNVKISFLIEAEGNEKTGEVIVTAEKRKNPYYKADYDENTEITRPCDIPFVEKQRQQSVVDDFRMYDAMEKYRTVDLLKDWSTWCLAYRSDRSKILKDFEREIKGYIGQVKEIDESKRPSKKGILDILIAFTRIYYIYEGDLKEEIAKAIETCANLLLDGKVSVEDEKPDELKELESLIRYGILFPKSTKAKEGLESGWSKLKEYLAKRINTEGCDIEKEPIKLAKTLTEIERLSLINDIKIPEEVFKPAEKLLEFIMYCSNPDGTISEVVDSSKQNVREWLYWGSKIYKRTDFRFVSFGGLDMENSFEPEKTSIAYPESGIYVMRNSWDIRDKVKRVIKDETRQRVMIIDSKDFHITVAGFNRILATIQPEKYRYKVSKWTSDEKGDELFLVDEINKEEKEITFANKEYWIIRSRGSMAEKAVIDLNGLEVIQTKEYIRAETIRTPDEDADQIRFLGRVLIAPY
ncbi:MAG: hypothetical protein V1752_06110, partial [Candidatus Firestonebacteria bacterium]